MNPLRRFKPLVVRHHRALAFVLVTVLPLILAACTNGGGSGPGY
jgi:hypothetical protein